MANREIQPICPRMSANIGVESITVDWGALMQAQKSDLCIGTRAKVTAGDHPKDKRFTNIQGSLGGCQQPITKESIQRPVPSQFIDENDAMKLNMWKGMSTNPQLF